MEKKTEDIQVQEKLEKIRLRLLEEPSQEELNTMQLHLGALEKLSKLKSHLMDDHHHDHMDDHDHTH